MHGSRLARFPVTRHVLSLLPLVLAWCAATPAAGVTLYDAGLGSTPSEQGWSTLVLGADAGQSVIAGRYVLDTTGAGVQIFGNALAAPLDTDAGFDLAFSLRLGAESHSSDNRAGYSVLMLGSDVTRSLEIAFWSDSVWVYDYDPGDSDRFVRGAQAALATTAPHDYVLAVRRHQFTLSADGALLLAGGLKDYSAEGPPYNTPNGLFFGDDTTRASSVSELLSVSLSPVPEPAAALLAVAGLALLGWRRSASPLRPKGM